jgi:hypothetical protein
MVVWVVRLGFLHLFRILYMRRDPVEPPKTINLFSFEDYRAFLKKKILNLFIH